MSMSAAIDRSTVEQIVREVVLGTLTAQAGSSKRGGSDLVVSISARHLHLTDEHVETLFGPGHKLTVQKPLYQDGFFAAEETVMVVGPRRRHAAHGPRARPDAAAQPGRAGVHRRHFAGHRRCRSAPAARSPARPAACWSGPRGVVELNEGVIRAERHVHMSLEHAARYGVKNGDRMNLRIEGTCTPVFEDLLVRADETSKLEVHIDTDEGNAADLDHATKVELFKQR